MNKNKLTKEVFEEILEVAIDAFGFSYVWDTIKDFNRELNFDDDCLTDPDEDFYWTGEEDE